MTRLTLALEAVDRGLSVFPLHSVRDGRCTCGHADCHSTGKHPLAELAPSWRKDATKDKKTVGEWWSQAPHANIGMATGSASDICVLDVDAKGNGHESLAELEKAHGPLPATWIVNTGGGGAHYYFRLPPGVELRNRAGIRPGLDFRGEGGYVVYPGSAHQSGAAYSWRTEPNGSDASPLPTWLVKILTEPEAANGTAVQFGAAIENGTRNDSLFRMACSLRAKGMPEDAALAALRVLNDKQVSPHLSDAELRSIVHSSTRYPLGSPESDWPEIVPLCAAPDVPDFPTEHLPVWLRDFVEADATAVQVPKALPAMLGLSVLAVACQGKVAARVRNDWSEPLSIFTLSAYPSGGRKTAVHAHACEPLESHEREEIESTRAEIAEAMNEYRVLEKRLERARKDAADSREPSQRADAARESKELARAFAEMKPPVEPRLLTEDVSPERLSQLLCQHGGRMAVFSTEATPLEIMGGRYSKNGAPNFDVFLRGHAGEALRVDRVGRGAEYVESANLTLALLVQPDVLHGLKDIPGAEGRGLLGRFLYALPTSQIGYRENFLAVPMLPRAIREEYGRRVRALLGLPFGTAPDGKQAPHYITLEADSLRELAAFQDWLEPQLRPAGPLGHIGSFGSKLLGAVVRIAALLHIADHADERAPWEYRLPPNAIRRARRITEDFLLPHALAAFREMEVDPSVNGARLVEAWIREGRLSAFTQREAYRSLRPRFKKPDDLAAPLKVAEDHGIIRRLPDDDRIGKPGRKPSPAWEVNPRLWEEVPRNSPVEAPSGASPGNCVHLVHSVQGSEGQIFGNGGAV